MLTANHNPSWTLGRYARNAFWMSLSVAIGIVQGVAVTYVMAHYLGLVAFGRLGLIITSTTLVLFASGSVTAAVLRESARGEGREPRLAVAGMCVHALVSLPVLLVSLAILMLVSGDHTLLGPASVLGLGLLTRSFITPAVALQLGQERMEWQLLESGHLLLSFVALLGLVAVDAGLYALPIASVLGAGVVASATMVTLGRRWTATTKHTRERPAAAGDGRAERPAVWSLVKTLAAASLVWGMVGLGQQAQWSAAPLLAPLLMSPAEVGLFIAGGRLLPTVRSLAAAFGVVILPAFVRAAGAADSQQLAHEAERSLRYLVPIGFVVTLTLYGLSHVIVDVLYPSGFAPAAAILRRLSLNVIPTLLHWQALCLLFAGEKPRELLAAYGQGAALRIVLGIGGGLAYGGPGLATAELASDWILAAMLQARAVRALSLSHAGTVLKHTASALGALLVLVLGGEVSPSLALLGALAAFALGHRIAGGAAATPVARGAIDGRRG